MNGQRTFHEIYDFYYQPFWKILWVRITFLCIVAGLLVGILWYRYCRKRKATVVLLTPQEWALRELQVLHQQLQRSKGEYKYVYFQLTNVIKIFLSRQYGWNIRHFTDEEFLVFLKECEEERYAETMQALISSSQLIKFANKQALPPQMQHDWQRVYDMISSSSGNVVD